MSPSGAEGFDDLGDAEKVKFRQTETAATLAHLDELLSELAGLRARVDDPDGLISLTLGFDGRLLELRIADGIGHVRRIWNSRKNLTTCSRRQPRASTRCAKACSRVGPSPLHRPARPGFVNVAGLQQDSPLAAGDASSRSPESCCTGTKGGMKGLGQRAGVRPSPFEPRSARTSWAMRVVLLVRTHCGGSTKPSPPPDLSRASRR